MLARVRRVAAVAAMSGTLLTGLAPSAAAQVRQDGLVNVAVNDVNVEVAVPVAVAAAVAANLCDIDVGPLALAVLGQAVAVDRSGRERTICESAAGPVTIEQNVEQ